MKTTASKIHLKPRSLHSLCFCCHPDDEAIHSMLSDEIMRISESAVYKNTVGYASSRLSETSDLAKADLLILIVSHKSLEGHAEILTNALKKAAERNIPVLPVLADSCSSSEIERVFEGRHCFTLNEKRRIDHDLSNRLEEYFSLFLRDDGLISRINKNAFRKKVFVSYRRKDKALVQAFLKKMQSDMRFVDVSLWRDSCLTPGEIFTDEIAQHISHSDVFLLCITDNTFEKGNYILEKELPLALQKQIPIVPVALTALSGQTPAMPAGCPEVICSENDALERIAELIPPSESVYDFPPKKSYLLGKAYWLGIGTEINFELAVFLNHLAAQQNDRNALHLLSLMEKYWHGESRNLENALTWNQNTICVLRKQAEHSEGSDSILQLCDALFTNAAILLTSPLASKDPGTTNVISRSQAVNSLREIIQRCKPLAGISTEGIPFTCVLARAYSKLSHLLYNLSSRLTARDPEASTTFNREALEYALALEMIFKEYEALNDRALKKCFLAEFLKQQKKAGMSIRSGKLAVDHERVINYFLICRLLDQANKPYSESREWYVRFCEFAWANLLRNPHGLENTFWSLGLLEACDGISRWLEYEERCDEAARIYELFFSGKISKHVADKRSPSAIPYGNLQEFGFQRLMSLYADTENKEKAAELWERHTKQNSR